MTPPKNKIQVHAFIGIINQYRDMWDWRSHLLHPLTTRMSPKLKFEWNHVEHTGYDEIERNVVHDILLEHPDFNKQFDIHMDASNHQLGAVISQDGKPIAFFSCKLTETRMRHTVTEKELISIVENLKEFLMILLGQLLKIYAYHKNITCKTLLQIVYYG